MSLDVSRLKHMFTSTIILAPTLDAQHHTIETSLHISLAPHPDLLVIDESPSISIETARSIGVWLSSRPYASAKKTVIILGAERLTVPAQHALLKTLEEPPTYAQIILTAENAYALLPTIQSRCVVVRGDFSSGKEDAQQNDSDSSLTIPSTYPEIFALSEELGKDRGVATEWCLRVMQKLHQLLQSKPSATLIHQLKAIQHTLHVLKHNVNVKLAIENMCFEIKHLA